jgi:hypothetical protein
MPDETPTPQPETPASPDAAAPAAQDPGAEPKKAAPKTEKPPKKEKPPALEDKPFTEFINQDFLPALKKTLGTMGFEDTELTFDKQPLPIQGLAEVGDCWQVRGTFRGSQKQFIIGFLKEDLQGQKFFSYAAQGAHPSTLESFMIDERRITLDLLLLYTVQRLNGQKWLVRN